MNLCLSGLADCYAKVDYPAVLQEAIARIRQAQPNAVTFSEACSGDVALIARRAGYHLRFSAVIYYGKLFACIKPGGRGVFGDAVLTRAPVRSSDSGRFRAQAGPELRQWLCVGTRGGIDVCTAHLASPAPEEVAANAPQCRELAALLVRRGTAGARGTAGTAGTARAVIFGGDVNRRRSCAPPGFWTLTDRSAHQDPGSQQVYGTGALRSPEARVVRAVHTDHDVLLAYAHLAVGR